MIFGKFKILFLKRKKNIFFTDHRSCDMGQILQTGCKNLFMIRTAFVFLFYFFGKKAILLWYITLNGFDHLKGKSYAVKNKSGRCFLVSPGFAA